VRWVVSAVKCIESGIRIVEKTENINGLFEIFYSVDNFWQNEVAYHCSYLKINIKKRLVPSIEKGGAFWLISHG
jgi:hypothetical protein